MNAIVEKNGLKNREKTSQQLHADHRATLAFTLVIVALLIVGWNNRDEYYLTAEYGVGYALGIVGGVMMLLLLLYPLRKRLRGMADWFPLRHWFRLHMIFGVIGPLCILYHCNFHLGATNSNVALACMTLMVTSGVIGRFIYVKIHSGLYGQKTSLQELQSEMQLFELQLQTQYSAVFDDTVQQRLQQLERYALKDMAMTASAWRVVSIGAQTRATLNALRRQLQRNKTLSAPQRRKLLQGFSAYLSVVRKIAGFSFYDRLFSLWHILHMPIFFMLVVTGIIHVFAVHMY